MTGWLFDIYGAERGMTVWMITGEGERLQLSIPYKPSFFVGGPPHVLRRVKETLGRTKPPVLASLTERADFWSGGMKPVLRIFSEVFCFHSLVKRVSRTSGVELYTCDIPPEQLFLYESGLFPLAFCEFETQGGVIRRIRNLDNPWDRAYSLPPLAIMKLSAHTNGANPNYGARNCPLRVEMDGTEYLLENDELLDALESMFLRHDPD
jgi:DNA polymerase-2